MSRLKSSIIEFLFKPSIVAGAFFLYPFMRYASPVRSWRIIELQRSGEEASRALWGPVSFAGMKMSVFMGLLACFMEADNAYYLWGERLIEAHARKMVREGVYDFDTQKEKDWKLSGKISEQHEARASQKGPRKAPKSAGPPKTYISISETGAITPYRP
jgi:hypothetical protein